MTVWNWQVFHKHLRDKAMALAPDYPNIEETDDPWELLWAITGVCEGTSLANDDLHGIIEELRTRLRLTRKEVSQISQELNNE